MDRSVRISESQKNKLGIRAGGRLTWRSLRTLQDSDLGEALSEISIERSLEGLGSYASHKWYDRQKENGPIGKKESHNYHTLIGKYKKFKSSVLGVKMEGLDEAIPPVQISGINGLLQDAIVWRVQAGGDEDGQQEERYGLATYPMNGSHVLVYVYLNGVEYGHKNTWRAIVKKQVESAPKEVYRSKVPDIEAKPPARPKTLSDKNIYTLDEYRILVKQEHAKHEKKHIPSKDASSIWYSTSGEDEISRIDAAIRARMLLIDKNSGQSPSVGTPTRNREHGFLFSDRALMALHDRFRCWSQCIKFVQYNGLLLGYISGAPVSDESLFSSTDIGPGRMNYNLSPESIYWKNNESESVDEVEAFCFSSIRLCEETVGQLYEILRHKNKNISKSQIEGEVQQLLIDGAIDILEDLRVDYKFKIQRVYLMIHQQFVKEWYSGVVNHDATEAYCKSNDIKAVWGEPGLSQELPMIGIIIRSRECLNDPKLLRREKKRNIPISRSSTQKK